jgi:hypothetical protein
VCTSDTGILDVAVELRRWPPIWNAAIGIVVIIISWVGYRIPCRKAGMAFLRPGSTLDSHEKNRQNDATNPNCTRVRVAGLGNAFKMDLEEVFVRAEERYHTTHKIYQHQQRAWTEIGTTYYQFW